MNAIDIGILVLLVLGALRGYRRGLLLTVVGLGSYLVGLLVATRYYGVVAAFLNNKLALSDRIAQYLGTSSAIPASATQVSVTLLQPSQVGTALSGLPIPVFAREELARSVDDIINLSFQQGITRLGEAVNYFFANIVVDALAFLLLCLVVGKLVRIIAGWLTDFTGGSLLGGMNRTAGLIAGAATTSLLLVVLAGVLVPFLTFAGQGKAGVSLAELLSQSVLVPHLMTGWHFLVRKLPLLLG
jgi:uncharacterized membrane protein required for colicin V production